MKLWKIMTSWVLTVAIVSSLLSAFPLPVRAAPGQPPTAHTLSIGPDFNEGLNSGTDMNPGDRIDAEWAAYAPALPEINGALETGGIRKTVEYAAEIRDILWKDVLDIDGRPIGGPYAPISAYRVPTPLPPDAPYAPGGMIRFWNGAVDGETVYKKVISCSENDANTLLTVADPDVGEVYKDINARIEEQIDLTQYDLLMTPEELAQQIKSSDGLVQLSDMMASSINASPTYQEKSADGSEAGFQRVSGDQVWQAMNVHTEITPMAQAGTFTWGLDINGNAENAHFPVQKTGWLAVTVKFDFKVDIKKAQVAGSLVITQYLFVTAQKTGNIEIQKINLGFGEVPHNVKFDVALNFYHELYIEFSLTFKSADDEAFEIVDELKEIAEGHKKANNEDTLDWLFRIFKNDPEDIDIINKDIAKVPITILELLYVEVAVAFKLSINFSIAIVGEARIMTANQIRCEGNIGTEDIDAKVSGGPLVKPRYDIHIAALGTIGLKVGFAPNVTVSIIGLMYLGSVGLETEFGAYIQANGFFEMDYYNVLRTAPALNRMAYDDGSDIAIFTWKGGIYWEVGIYLGLNLVIKARFLPIKYTLEIIKLKIPVYADGNALMFLDFEQTGENPANRETVTIVGTTPLGSLIASDGSYIMDGDWVDLANPQRRKDSKDRRSDPEAYRQRQTNFAAYLSFSNYEREGGSSGHFTRDKDGNLTVASSASNGAIAPVLKADMTITYNGSDATFSNAPPSKTVRLIYKNGQGLPKGVDPHTEYTVTYIVGGKVAGTRQVPVGLFAPNITVDLEKDFSDYYFIEWDTIAAGPIIKDTTIVAEENLDAYRHRGELSVVCRDTQNSKSVWSSYKLQYGEPVQLPTGKLDTPSYKFMGWKLDTVADLDNLIYDPAKASSFIADPANMKMGADLKNAVIYAVYEPILRAVTIRMPQVVVYDSNQNAVTIAQTDYSLSFLHGTRWYIVENEFGGVLPKIPGHTWEPIDYETLFPNGVTGDTVINMVFIPNKHTVTFVDYSGAVLKTEQAGYGASAAPPINVPQTLEISAGYISGYPYTFTGEFVYWRPNPAVITTDCTIKPCYRDAGEIRFNITFDAGNFTFAGRNPENKSYAVSVPKGMNPVHWAQAPIKPSDDNYHYVFNGWACYPAIEDRTYSVTDSDFTAIPREYTITIRSGDGVFPDGATVKTVKGGFAVFSELMNDLKNNLRLDLIPAVINDGINIYSFKDWGVSKDYYNPDLWTFYAYYGWKDLVRYTLTFKISATEIGSANILGRYDSNWDQELLDMYEITRAVQSTLNQLPDAVKKASGGTNYELDYWLCGDGTGTKLYPGESIYVTGDATYTAVFREVPILMINVGKGTFWTIENEIKIEVPRGSRIAYRWDYNGRHFDWNGDSVIGYAEGDSYYQFDCWKYEDGATVIDPPTTLNGHMTIYAVYKEIPNRYEISFDAFGGEFAGGTTVNSLSLEFGDNIADKLGSSSLGDPTKSSAGGVDYTFKEWIGLTADMTVTGDHKFLALYSASDDEPDWGHFGGFGIQRTGRFINGSEVTEVPTTIYQVIYGSPIAQNELQWTREGGNDNYSAVFTGAVSETYGFECSLDTAKYPAPGQPGELYYEIVKSHNNYGVPLGGGHIAAIEIQEFMRSAGAYDVYQKTIATYNVTCVPDTAASLGAAYPSVNRYPINETVPLDTAPGAKHDLSVRATSVDGGVLSYQWYRDGLAIQGATSSTYEAPVTAAGVYQYSVDITNTVSGGGESGAGSVTRTGGAFTLTVLENKTYEVIVSTIGTGALGNGEYTPGDTVYISAGAVTEGWRFKNWATETPGVVLFGPSAENTAFIMPARFTAVDAVFEMQRIVKSVEVNPSSVTIRDGATYQFSATVLGINEPSQDVNWKLTGGIPGTSIDSAGLLTVASGETATFLTVTAISKNNTGFSGAATVLISDVAPPAPTVTGIRINPTYPHLYLGEIFTLSAVVMGANNPQQSVVWTVEGGNERTTITPGGVLTVAADETSRHIYVKAASLIPGYEGIYEIMAIGILDPFFPVTSIINVPATATARTPLTLTGTVVPSHATNKTIIWSVQDAGTTGATIAGENTLHTTAAGAAVILATIKNGVAASVDYTQSFSIAVSSQTTPPTTYKVAVNGSYASNTGAGSYASGAAVTIHAGSRSGYSFDGWTTNSAGVSFTNAKSATTTFTMPADNVTATANWRAIGGDSGGRTPGGGSSGGGYTPPGVIDPIEKKPDKPAMAKYSVAGTASDRVLNAAITEGMARSALNAVTDAGGDKAVQFNLASNGAYESVYVAIERAALEALIAAGVEYIQITTGVLDITLDLKSIEAILNQTTGDIALSATKETRMSDAAKRIIGRRPFMDINIKGADGESVSDLKGGSVTLGFVYKPAAKEQTSRLCGVHVDRKNKVNQLTDSGYNNGRVIFSRGTLSLYGVGYSAPPPEFTDAAAHWAKEDIEFVARRGLIAGTSATAFSPDIGVTRADFLMALGKISGADVSVYKKSSFNDVPNTNPAMPYIEWAAKNDVVAGIGDNNFGPDNLITREQMAVMMVNYAEVTNYKLPISRRAVTFADDAIISSWAKEHVKSIQQAGIIVGKDNNRFDPQGNATRGEAATILRRFVELVIDEGAARGWAQNDSGQWQYIDALGKAVTGWRTIDGRRYYFDKNGIIA